MLMKRVIDIPEETFRYYVTLVNKGEQIGNLERIILDGTPLPEHHGRLIDADEAIKTLRSLGNRDYRREKGTIKDAMKMLDYDGYTPTIIEGSNTE